MGIESIRPLWILKEFMLFNPRKMYKRSFLIYIQNAFRTLEVFIEFKMIGYFQTILIKGNKKIRIKIFSLTEAKALMGIKLSCETRTWLIGNQNPYKHAPDTFILSYYNRLIYITTAILTSINGSKSVLCSPAAHLLVVSQSPFLLTRKSVTNW